jgi:hypothetical protein
VITQLHTDSLLPQPETLEHFLDHVTFVDEGDDPHLALAVRADKGIGLPYLFDEFAPFFGRNAAGRSRRDAFRDHRPQASNPLGAIVDAGRKGAGPEKPPGPRPRKARSRTAVPMIGSPSAAWSVYAPNPSPRDFKEQNDTLRVKLLGHHTPNLRNLRI